MQCHCSVLTADICINGHCVEWRWSILTLAYPPSAVGSVLSTSPYYLQLVLHHGIISTSCRMPSCPCKVTPSGCTSWPRSRTLNRGLRHVVCPLNACCCILQAPWLAAQIVLPFCSVLFWSLPLYFCVYTSMFILCPCAVIGIQVHLWLDHVLSPDLSVFQCVVSRDPCRVLSLVSLLYLFCVSCFLVWFPSFGLQVHLVWIMDYYSVTLSACALTPTWIKNADLSFTLNNKYTDFIQFYSASSPYCMLQKLGCSPFFFFFS